MEGWIKLHRKLLENDIWHDVTTFRLFTLLLLKASYQDGLKINGITVNKGQYIRSYSKLAEDLTYKEGRGFKSIAKSTISKSVKKLIDNQMIQTEDTLSGTLFTIINYTKYQELDSQNEVKSSLKIVPNQEDAPAFEQIENKFIQYRARGFDPSLSDVQAISRLLKQDIPIDSILKWMDEINQKYQSNNPGQTIGSFAYYERVIMNSLEKKQQKASNVTPFPKPRKETSMDAIARFAQKHGVTLGGMKDGNE